ncbi:MAG: hypothetical protein GXY41_11630 [Phycisphaerae bacterium]|nr:hypothetical protein [Phycisphaerae bacterium]
MTDSNAQLENAKILLGISGGIAAYKAADLAGKLTAAGAQVRTVMTENACKLITPVCIQALTHQPVYTSMWAAPSAFDIGHIELADWADAVVVAPATANILAKIANGLCDDLLSTTLCVVWNKPVLLAPAMNSRMWDNPVVQGNLTRIRQQLKFRTLGPDAGRLACGTEGLGRMADPAAILDAVTQMIKSRC